jgi:CDP-diacylglycerol--glycerol-3-phosphate 3-phosphatidyltransferase
LKRILDQLLAPLLMGLARLRVKPDFLTLLGVLLSFPVCVALARGEWRRAALWLFAASLFDLLDGALARHLKSERLFGAFLDSTMDRVSEALVFLGFVLYYEGLQDRAGTALAFGTGFLSQLISYARARAEGLGLQNQGGWVTRPVRVFILGAGLLIRLPKTMLLILALLSLVTVFQRIYHVFKRTRK